MRIDYYEVQRRIKRDEDVYAYGTTLTLTTENYSTSSPHISGHCKPIFGEIKQDGHRFLFFKEKANGKGFVSTGRLFDGLTCFDDEMEAVSFFNNEIKKFISLKNQEIDEAQKLTVDTLKG